VCAATASPGRQSHGNQALDVIHDNPQTFFLVDFAFPFPPEPEREFFELAAIRHREMILAVAMNWDHDASVALGAIVDRLVVAESSSP
jgi:hypothetical protein